MNVLTAILIVISLLAASNSAFANLYTLGTPNHGKVSAYESLLPDSTDLLIIVEDDRTSSAK